MKKLLIGALCIMSACQSKTNQINKQTKTAFEETAKHSVPKIVPKEDSIAVQTLVRVVDYDKKLFRVYTLAGHFYRGHSGPCMGEGCELYFNGKTDTIKLIVSNPIPEYFIDKIKVHQFNIAREVIGNYASCEQSKKQLDNVAFWKSGIGNIPQRTKQFDYNIFYGKHTGYTSIKGCCNVIIGNYKHMDDIKLYMVWDIDYIYLQKVSPKSVQLVKWYQLNFVGHETEDQRKEFISYLGKVL